LDAQPALPFSFVYDGLVSEKLLPDWTRRHEVMALDRVRTQHVFHWTDRKTGLEIRCIAVAYDDCPVVEWTVYFKNKDTRISGGRRNDLETMRRAVPLLRSDFQLRGMAGVVEGNQGHTYGLSFWLPFQGTGVYSYEAYSYRSFYLPSFGMGRLTSDSTAAQQKAYAECRTVAPMMLQGDDYPRTPYCLKSDQWIGWPFNRPEQGDGVAQAFRRKDCAEQTMVFRLKGLDPAARYEVVSFDAEDSEMVSGRNLIEKGLNVKINDKPGAAVTVYRRLNGWGCERDANV